MAIQITIPKETKINKRIISFNLPEESIAKFVKFMQSNNLKNKSRTLEIIIDNLQTNGKKQ